MKFASRIVLFILRPIYRAFFERPLWWFLSKVKAYFFAETATQLEDIERRLRQDQYRANGAQYDEQHWAAIEERLRRLEENNAAQWDAMEQLLLALFRQSELRTPDPAAMPAADSMHEVDLDRVHAAGNLH